MRQPLYFSVFEVTEGLFRFFVGVVFHAGFFGGAGELREAQGFELPPEHADDFFVAQTCRLSLV